MVKAGLILEGGALRGVFTSAVLDVFMDRGLYFSDVFSVSAGSTNALSYISKQKGRTMKINLKYVKDKRYLSMRNYIRDRSIFGFDFIFHDIADKLEPFDFETFENSQQRLIAVASNCDTGDGVYFDKYNCTDMFLACRASCSMPFLAPIIHVNNIPCLDGGISDAIPIERALQEGIEKNVIILTRHKGYRKKQSKEQIVLAKKFYSYYPKIVKAIMTKSERYNKTLDYIEDLEKQGKVFVIRPNEPVTVSRTEKDTKKLMKLYMQGYSQALDIYDDILNYLNNSNSDRYIDLQYTKVF